MIEVQAQRDLAIGLENVAGLLRSCDSGHAFALYKEAYVISRQLSETAPSIQSYRDRGVVAARLAEMFPGDPLGVKLWCEAATSLGLASEMDAKQPTLARMAWVAANECAACDAEDAEDWLVYAASLAERFE